MRGFRLLTAVLAIGAATVLAPAVASAQPVRAGTFAFTSDPGDWIGWGGSYSYSADRDNLEVDTLESNNTVHVSASAANFDRWDLYLAAPRGRALAVGEYPNAGRWPFQTPDAPAISLFGNGRGCSSSGSFTITNIAFGPAGYVHQLDATFEQYCDNSEDGLRGEVHIANPPPPPMLELGATIAAEGTFSRLNGSATVAGTISCNAGAEVSLTVFVTQVAHRTIIRGHHTMPVACTPDEPVAWVATVHPDGTTPYQKGNAEVALHASATDPTYNVPVTLEKAGPVRLHRQP